MRNLARDTQTVHISRYEGIVRERDAQGRLTGRNAPQMSEPVPFSPSASMARGEAQGAHFGDELEYDVVLTLDDPGFEASEADVLWVWADPQSEEHDFAVRKVARKGCFTVIAAKRVVVSP